MALLAGLSVLFVGMIANFGVAESRSLFEDVIKDFENHVLPVIESTSHNNVEGIMAEPFPGPRRMAWKVVVRKHETFPESVALAHGLSPPWTVPLSPIHWAAHVQFPGHQGPENSDDPIESLTDAANAIHFFDFLGQQLKDQGQSRKIHTKNKLKTKNSGTFGVKIVFGDTFGIKSNGFKHKFEDTNELKHDGRKTTELKNGAVLEATGNKDDGNETFVVENEVLDNEVKRDAIGVKERARDPTERKKEFGDANGVKHITKDTTEIKEDTEADDITLGSNDNMPDLSDTIQHQDASTTKNDKPFEKLGQDSDNDAANGKDINPKPVTLKRNSDGMKLATLREKVDKDHSNHIQASFSVAKNLADKTSKVNNLSNGYDSADVQTKERSSDVKDIEDDQTKVSLLVDKAFAKENFKGDKDFVGGQNTARLEGNNDLNIVFDGKNEKINPENRNVEESPESRRKSLAKQVQDLGTAHMVVRRANRDRVNSNVGLHHDHDSDVGTQEHDDWLKKYRADVGENSQNVALSDDFPGDGSIPASHLSQHHGLSHEKQSAAHTVNDTHIPDRKENSSVTLKKDEPVTKPLTVSSSRHRRISGDPVKFFIFVVVLALLIGVLVFIAAKTSDSGPQRSSSSTALFKKDNRESPAAYYNMAM